jgi:hypothetical protein
MERFFILRENSLSERMYSLESAIMNAQGADIIVEKFTREVDVNGTNPWRLYSFSFYDISGEPKFVEINGWKLNSIETVYKTGDYVNYLISISDPRHVVQEFERTVLKQSSFKNRNDQDIQTVIEAKVFFLEMSKNDNWNHLSIIEENERLKKEIDTLKRK